MTIRSMLTAVLTTLGILTLLATPLQGGEILIGGQNGTTDPPAPSQGAKSEEDWNPIVSCVLGEGEGIFDLLNCLQNEILNPPPPCDPNNTGEATGPKWMEEYALPCTPYPFSRDEFNVSILEPPPDRWGIEIRRLDNTEITRIGFRENDPGIQTSELSLDVNGHVARLRRIEETPAGGGMIYLTVNAILVSVSTSTFHTPDAINAEIIRQLNPRFTVTPAGDYLHIRCRPGMGFGVRRIQLRSTDTGIISSDLSLLPGGDPVLQADVEPPMP